MISMTPVGKTNGILMDERLANDFTCKHDNWWAILPFGKLSPPIGMALLRHFTFI